MVHVNISFGPTGDAAEPARLIRNDIYQAFGNVLPVSALTTTLAHLLVTVMIIDPRVGKIPSGVTHRRLANEVHSTAHISYEEFMTASQPARVSMFCAGVRRAFEQINDRLLSLPDKTVLIRATNKACDLVLSKLGGVTQTHEVIASSQNDEPEFEDNGTQVVLQWPKSALASASISQIEELLSSSSMSAYEVDGHDIGSGTINIFLDAKNLELSLRVLNAIAETDALPAGLRIGLESEGGYRPLYPKGLQKFDL